MQVLFGLCKDERVADEADEQTCDEVSPEQDLEHHLPSLSCVVSDCNCQTIDRRRARNQCCWNEKALNGVRESVGEGSAGE